ncbi:MAG: hypothetical protein C4325_06350 [Blastocatellia bacterium]
MSYPRVAKRLIPFLLTFAAGLFVASFFVSISPPSFRSFFRPSEGCEKMHRGKIRNPVNELRDLRDENERLRNELQLLREFYRDEASRALEPGYGSSLRQEKQDSLTVPQPGTNLSGGPKRPAASF